MLSKMLDYQKEESNKITLENELSKSTDREKASKIQQVLKKQHSDLIELETSAEKINGIYKSMVEKYNEYLKKLEALEKEIQNADPEKSEFYEKMYNDFLAVGASLEKNIKSVYVEVQKINNSYEDIINKSKKDRVTFDKYSKAYKLLKQEKEPKIQASKEKMDTLVKGINSKIFSMYNQKRESHIFPVFVALAENRCGGCRMEISASNLGKMKNNEFGIIECENCSRYIYQN